MHRETITPESIYSPTWEFSQAVKVQDPRTTLYVSGIMGYRPDGTMPEGMVAQAEQAYANLRAVLEEAGGSLADIVKVTVFVGEDFMSHREEMRSVRSRFWPSAPYPASTLVRVAGFANPEYLFEIEAVAALG
ncbi:MAG: RidA family protein [Microcella sp.]|uniref:RidA family protein n=1 Tax=Microcella sp. TaxID=1913979 RepID=UPI003315F684